MQPEFVKKYSGVTCTVELAFLFSKYQLCRKALYFYIEQMNKLNSLLLGY